MLSVDEIEAIADELSPSMQHALLRCSDAGFGAMGYAPRCWWDVVAHRANCTLAHTITALERRGLIEITRPAGLGAMVAMTREGGRVQAALRLRQ